MGLIEGALGALLGRGGGPAKTILRGVMGMVAGGGLSKVLSAFKDKGMGAQADSWVSTGDNEPLTADQVRQALSPEQLQQIADRAGISVDEAADQVAAALPEVVNQVTPDGQVPADADVDAQLKQVEADLQV
ncbi:MAG TPA: YidB family protein [Miltoncostaeales bacterium]|jgi:uncharacterized protein YidB (DUF937 family)|nr:YidB family protein [Miltoncostaeales bacterium]